VKIFADVSRQSVDSAVVAGPAHKGFTTNPTLMRKAGVADYEWFARDVIEAIPDRLSRSRSFQTTQRDGRASENDRPWVERLREIP